MSVGSRAASICTVVLPIVILFKGYAYISKTASFWLSVLKLTMHFPSTMFDSFE